MNDIAKAIESEMNRILSTRATMSEDFYSGAVMAVSRIAANLGLKIGSIDGKFVVEA